MTGIALRDKPFGKVGRNDHRTVYIFSSASASVWIRGPEEIDLWLYLKFESHFSGRASNFSKNANYYTFIDF